MPFTPTKAYPHPNCRNMHSLAAGFTPFIMVRLFATGWPAFGLYAALGLEMAAADSVRRMRRGRGYGCLAVRRGWQRTAVLLDDVRLYVQWFLTLQLLLQPHVAGFRMGLTIWIFVGVNFILNFALQPLHHRATREQIPEKPVTEEGQ